MAFSLVQKVRGWRAEVEKLRAKGRGIVEAALGADGNGNLSPEQRTEVDGLNARIGEIEAEISRALPLIEEERTNARDAAPSAIASLLAEGRNSPLAGLQLPDVAGLVQGQSSPHYFHHALGVQPFQHSAMVSRALGMPFRAPDLAIGGFRSIEEWMGACLVQGLAGSDRDERLPAYAGSPVKMSAADRVGSNDPTQGAGLVHTVYSSLLLERIFATGEILSRCAEQSIGDGFDSFEFPRVLDADKSTLPFAGLQVYWAQDGKAVDWSKVQLEWRKYNLSPLRGLLRISEKNLRDSAAVGSYAMRTMPQAFEYELSKQVLFGRGGNKPFGCITNGDTKLWPGTYQVSKGSTTAGNVEADNVIDMYAHMDPRDLGGSVWFVTPELMKQLMLLKVATGTGSGQLVGWMPPNGLSGSPYGTLFGRPVIFNPYSKAAGELGDIALLNLGRYLTLRKNGLRMASSLHFFFDTHDEAIRWEMEFAGFPEEDRKTKLPTGFETSPYVVLQKRNA